VFNEKDLPDDQCGDERGAPAARKPRTRVNWTPAERSKWLALFEKSGRSVSEFCRANDLPPPTLSLWGSQQYSGAANQE